MNKVTRPSARVGEKTPPHTAPVARKRLALVDDHPMVRERLAEIIRQEPDLEVCGEAESRAQALTLITSQRPHLVILDLSLKDAFGLDLIRDLRACQPGLQVLVLTMHESALYAERALRAGASGYLTKRDATTRILTAIREVLAGDVYLSESLAGRVVKHLTGGGKGVPTLERLSDRELEVLRRLGGGENTREIAEALHLDMRTVETYRARIKTKLDLKNGQELLRFAIEWRQAGEGI
jgi:DNA-binding NarL/FixJ family response regulator